MLQQLKMWTTYQQSYDYYDYCLLECDAMQLGRQLAAV